MKGFKPLEEYQREWIEFGKMMDAMGNGVSLISNGEGKFAAIDSCFSKTILEDDYVHLSIKVQTTDYEWFDTPLEALKFYYFSSFLETETENVNLNFSPQEWRRIIATADEEYITVDEVVARVLKEYLDIEHQCSGCGCL